jgi:hypothetical protein
VSVSLSAALSGAGTPADPYVTQRQDVVFDVSLVGKGRLVLTNADGQTVASYDKTTEAAETVQLGARLGAVGDYTFTATYYHLDDPSVIWNIVQATVRFEALSVVPGPDGGANGGPAGDGLGAPTTGLLGYLYIGGYAVPTLEVLAGLVMILTALILGVRFELRRKQSQRVGTNQRGF